MVSKSTYSFVGQPTDKNKRRRRLLRCIHDRLAFDVVARHRTALTEGSCCKHVLPNLRMRVALINSPEIGRRGYRRRCSYFYYTVAGCIKMGKYKFTDEIAQRKHQKAKHKLKFTPKKSLCVLSALRAKYNTHVMHAAGEGVTSYSQLMN